MPLISSSSLRSLLGSRNLRIVDCRYALADKKAGRAAYEVSRISGAVYAGLSTHLSGPGGGPRGGRHPLPDLKALLSTLGKLGISRDTHVVAYDSSGGRYAARLWWLLTWLGHSQVSVLDATLETWHHSGGPVDTKAGGVQPATRSYKLPSGGSFPRMDMTVDADTAASMAEDRDEFLIDVRAYERFAGLIEPIDAVAGHIPGAVSAPDAHLCTSSGEHVSPEAIRQHFSHAIGRRCVDPSSMEHCALYCGSGVTAAHSAMCTMHAGLGLPRIYPGSWSEWSAAGREIEVVATAGMGEAE